MRGHQSLVQLVGKRRRGISLENSNLPSQPTNAADAATPVEALVECPVCTRRLPEASINDHLDSCLASGRKKCKQQKQVQLTLFHMKHMQADVQNTGSTTRNAADGKPNTNVHMVASSSSEREHFANGIQDLPRGSTTRNVERPAGGIPNEHSVHMVSSSLSENAHFANGTKENKDGSFSMVSISTGKTRFFDAPHVEPSSSKQTQANVLKDLNSDEHSITRSHEMLSFNTHIVGRKFYKEAPCYPGMEFRLERDPENKVDPHAVKVLSAESQENVIGYIPKTVAFHLSSMPSCEFNQIKGCVQSVPLNLHNPVDVTIWLEGNVDENWENALRAAACKDVVAVRKGREENFLYLMNTVLHRDAHLFSDEEKAHLEPFYSLSPDTQRLFLRLSQRKGPWFRVGSLSYEDVSDVNTAAQDLIDAGFLTSSCENWLEGHPEALGDYLEVACVQELRNLVEIAKILRRSDVASLKKNDLKKLVIENRSNAVFDNMAKIVGLCVRISDTTMFLLWRLQRLFFLNGEQDLQVFLMVDLGKAKYPTYKCSRTMPVFRDRAALLAYEQALHVAQVVDMSLEANDSEKLHSSLAAARSELEAAESNSTSDHPFFLRFSARWVYTTICTVAVSVFERERRYADAAYLLKRLLDTKWCPGRRGYWTLRLSVDLEHLGRPEESLQVAENGLIDPDVRGGDRLGLQRRIVRLGKPPRRWKVPSFAAELKRKHKMVEITGRPLNNVVGVKSRFYGYNDQQCSVEELALAYYTTEEGGAWSGVHSESGVWLTLFGLLMWDVIFSDVPDVFQTPFQIAPLDLDTDVFYPTRSLLIESRLESIRNGYGAEIITEAWTQHHGTYCRGLNWEKYTFEELQEIAACIGGSGLAAVCKLLCEDRASGMPDLLLWKNRADVRQAKLSEVKGPGDRLSEQQNVWLFTLADAGLHVEVCKVVRRCELL